MLREGSGTLLSHCHRRRSPPGRQALELRATVSFARLMANHGRRDEARTMLGEIYNWFTDGFDTPNLKEARALLDELGRE
jgi:predicted ATPase